MTDEVQVSIGATRFTSWEALTISRALDSGADAFSLSAPFDPDRPELVAAFTPFGYQPAVVTIDGDLILTGRVESIAAAMAGEDRAVNVQGRALSGVLIDCAIDGVGYEFSGLTLKAIAEKIAAPFGLGVSVGGLGAAAAARAIAEARAEPGARAWDFIAGLARDVGALVTNDAQGWPQIMVPNPLGAPVAVIDETKSALISIEASYDGTRRFSNYKTLIQQDGGEGYSGEAADTGISLYRPTIETGSQAPASGAIAAAGWSRALGLAGAIQVSVSVSGWRTDAGILWAPGQLITLKAPSVMIARETAFMIAAVDLALDSQAGRTAALRLILPATYTGTMPGVYPWA